MFNIKNFTDETARVAAKLGIEKYDIYGAVTDESNVKVKDGGPDQISGSQRSSVTVRVWRKKGTVGVASTTELTPEGIEIALKVANEASAFGVEENAPDFSPEATLPLAGKAKAASDLAPIPELLKALIKAEKEVLTAHSAIKGVPYNGIGQKKSQRFYVNSAGAARHEERSSSFAYLYTRTEQEGKRPRSAGEYVIANSFPELKVDNCVRKVVEKTVRLLDYKKINSGQYTVVFSPDAFLDLLGAFSNMFDAQRVLDRQSLSTEETLGKEIASTLLKIEDDPLHPENVGATLFDSEGTPTRKVTLVDHGVLSSFLHSAGTAKRMNAKLTGNANIGAKVSVSPHYFHVSRAEANLPTRSLDNEKSVIYVDSLHALHAGVNALQGSFSLPFDGFIVESGKFTSVESATVAGDFLKLLKDISYLGATEHVTPGGICPDVWVEGLSIASE